MAIKAQRITDASRALAFASDVYGAYSILKEMQTKIQRYMDGVANGTDTTFVNIVQAMVDPGDLTRIGALKPTIDSFVSELEANYSDFISPG